MLQDNQKKENVTEKEKSEKNPEATTNNKAVLAAHEQAEADIKQDPDTSVSSPADDLDEGELARLNDDDNDLI